MLQRVLDAQAAGSVHLVHNIYSKCLEASTSVLPDQNQHIYYFLD